MLLLPWNFVLVEQAPSGPGSLHYIPVDETACLVETGPVVAGVAGGDAVAAAAAAEVAAVAAAAEVGVVAAAGSTQLLGPVRRSGPP